LKESTKKLKIKAEDIGGYAKKFCNVHELKEDKNDISYLTNSIWMRSDIINKQKDIKVLMDIRKYFAYSKKLQID